MYLANYGTLSHNNDEQTVNLLSKIAEKSKDGALILIDWLGRYSYEWQSLWTKELESNQWMDYVISYIYTGNGKKQDSLTHFPLRIMGRNEVEEIHRLVVKKVEGTITLLQIADRSSFVGRHIETAQYNSHCRPLRRLVNSLFEPNVSTDLDELLIHYVPKEGFAEINAYYQKLTDWWNYIIIYTKALLEKRNPPKLSPRAPTAVKTVIDTMEKVVTAAARMKIGNPRASLLEPQLGYCLRELEIGLQKGLGCGHGLVAIFEIIK